jgi:hypothetical protein
MDHGGGSSFYAKVLCTVSYFWRTHTHTFPHTRIKPMHTQEEDTPTHTARVIRHSRFLKLSHQMIVGMRLSFPKEMKIQSLPVWITIVGTVAVALLVTSSPCEAFLAPSISQTKFSSHSLSSRRTELYAKYSSLPQGISPFEKSVARGLDVQGSMRKLAVPAVERAIADGKSQIEIDFPVLIGGAQSKTQFDDFDNISELNANRDWSAQFAPMIADNKRKIWLVLPDDKECELAKKEWTGQRFLQAARFTSIRAACAAVISNESFSKAWGSSIAETVNKLSGGDGILADSSTLDELDVSGSRLHLVCQPGNGGPVEDWINLKKLHEADPSQVTLVVNGALDKVRDGYYPAIFFPALGATASFYKEFEAALVLKPITDKGLYGWLYRVYPEPWQVILQTAKQVQRGDTTIVQAQDYVALVSETRPTYAEAVKAMVAANQAVRK